MFLIHCNISGLKMAYMQLILTCTDLSFINVYVGLAESPLCCPFECIPKCVQDYGRDEALMEHEGMN